MRRAAVTGIPCEVECDVLKIIILTACVAEPPELIAESFVRWQQNGAIVAVRIPVLRPTLHAPEFSRNGRPERPGITVASRYDFDLRDPAAFVGHVDTMARSEEQTRRNKPACAQVLRACAGRDEQRAN